jgi:hypothetical protein
LGTGAQCRNFGTGTQTHTDKTFPVPAAGILEKSHKVEKNWKKFNLKQYFLVFTNKHFIFLSL